MKRGKIAILAMTILLSVTVVVFGKVELRRWNFPFSVEIISDNHREDLRCMEIDGEYYVFLPSYAEREEIRFYTNFLYDVYIDGQKLTEETTCADFALNMALELSAFSLDYEEQKMVTFMQSANVPTMYIDVESGQMEYIHAKKGNEESGEMRLYSVDGQLEHIAAVESIHGRGNSTWQWAEKKPYSIRLSAETNLLGMGTAQRWILLANAFDNSQLRNKIVYDLARNAGMPYSPQCEWIDLYLNGSYAGLYLLSERNEIHPNRVDIPAGSSFLVSWESEDRLLKHGYTYVKTERETSLRVHQSAMDVEEIQTMWQSVENAIFAENGIDPLTGKYWEELIDLDSWAMLFLLDEISGDHDGGLLSKFFYYNDNDDTGKIYAGPVWDKDDAFGATGHWSVASPNCIVASRSRMADGIERAMFAGLFQKEVFSSRVVELYESVFLPLLEELYDEGIEEYVHQISEAALLNKYRWGLLSDSIAASDILRDFVGRRMEFLNAYWLEQEEFYHIKINDTFEGAYSEFAVRPGSDLSELPKYEDWAWFCADTDIPFDISQPIYEDVSIILKRLDKAETIIK